MKKDSKYVNFLEGILIGGSMGAALTFMFGTKEGKRLQEKLVKKYKSIEHKAEGYWHNVEKAVKSPVAKKLKRLAKKAVSTAKAPKKAASKVKRRIKRKVKTHL